jgi:hypothetical protein
MGQHSKTEIEGMGIEIRRSMDREGTIRLNGLLYDTT